MLKTPFISISTLFIAALFSINLQAASGGQYDNIQQLLESGQLVKAEQLLNSLDDQSTIQARILLGILLSKKGENQRAITSFEAIIKEFPSEPEAYNNLAVIHASKGEYLLAENNLSKALETNKSYQTTYQNLRNIYSLKAGLAYSKALKNHKKSNGISLSYTVPVTRAKEAIKLEPAKQEKNIQVAKTNVDTNKVRERLQNWALAWSNKDIKGYLDAFSDDYSPTNWQRRNWINQRKQRITSPKYIKVTLSNMEIEVINDNIAIAHFVQDYQSDNYHDKEIKLMVLRKIKQQWKITEEAKPG